MLANKVYTSNICVSEIIELFLNIQKNFMDVWNKKSLLLLIFKKIFVSKNH